MSTPQNPMMQQAMGMMSNPNAQAVPPAQPGVIDPTQHPIIGAIIKALASGMQGFSQTSMDPRERMQRQEMDAQKAEAMGRLAETQAMREQTGQWREEQAATARDRAGTYGEDVESKKQARETSAQIQQSKLDLAKSANEWKQAMAQGRLDVAHQQLTQKAQQFEDMMKIRVKQVGIEQAKLELMDQATQIKAGFLDLGKTALAQRGTTQGADIAMKLSGLSFEHPILSQLIGLDDVSGLVGQGKGAGIPGVGGTPAPTTGQPTAPISAPPAPNRNTPPKKNGGAAFHYDNQGNRVQGP